MDRTAVTWDVVATVKAPMPYVARFVEVYRSLGAARIHIFYDDPALSFALPGDDLVQRVCTPEYWAGKRPRAVEKRQMQNATRAALASSSDWILHCDIDEFLHAPRPVSDVLARVPDGCGCYRVLPAEAVFASRPQTTAELFATPFFKSTRPGWQACRDFWQGIYGPLYEHSRAGFWGHRVGKSLIRRSRLAEIGTMPIHMPSGAPLAGLAPVVSKDLTLRHFDALLPDEWLRKHLDRVEGRVKAVWAGAERNRQSQLIHDAHTRQGPEAALALYDRMYVLDRPSLDAGLALGTVIALADQAARP